MRPMRLAIVVVLLLPALLGSVTIAEGPWAKEGEATVHPGVPTVTAGARCTANFVFEQFRKVNDELVREVFLGQAAHCAASGDNTQTNGCTTPVQPTGTLVDIEGASRAGTLVYSSWSTMQAKKETNSDRCNGNDFALVLVHQADWDKVNPTVPVWGGPRKLGNATAVGENVYTYGRSPLRFGLHSDREGVSLGTENAGWSHRVYTFTPGIPGDSGSAFLDEDGDAMGVLSTVALAPYPASNRVSDLAKALAYMKQHTNRWDNVQLAAGTRSFGGGILP